MKVKIFQVIYHNWYNMRILLIFISDRIQLLHVLSCFFAYIHNEGNVIFHWEVSKRRNFLSHHGTPEFSPWTHGHMQYPECRKLYKCIYLYLLPLPEMWHFLWALSIIFLALITTILGSCWNKAVWLATVEYLSQRVEATVLKILDLKLQTCALWCCV